MNRAPDKVHFVGSIALETVPDVFRSVGALCGRRLRRIPDGEPGGRRMWIAWQWPLLRANPWLRLADEQRGLHDGPPLLELVDDAAANEISFTELGYAREARTSYQDFLAARSRGELPAQTRFQVSLPTPFAVVSAWVTPGSSPSVLPAYERAMLAEVARIADAIPHTDLAIQWDVCVEMLIWDGQPSFVPQFPGARELIVSTLSRCLNAVAPDIEMGVHLCYGSVDGELAVQPVDAGEAVDLANRIIELAERPVHWIHMPVPIDRTDDAFFTPLADLRRGEDTELYLGLIHADGRDTDRIAAAARVVDDFGVATECGISRRPSPEQVLELVQAHAAATVEP